MYGSKMPSKAFFWQKYILRLIQPHIHISCLPIQMVKLANMTCLKDITRPFGPIRMAKLANMTCLKYITRPFGPIQMVKLANMTCLKHITRPNGQVMNRSKWPCYVFQTSHIG